MNWKPCFSRFFSFRQQCLLLILALFVLVLFWFRFDLLPSPLPSAKPYREMAVEVVGVVRAPGIHRFESPPTLLEVIERAGGLGEIALPERSLPSTVLETGTQITLLRKESGETRIRLGRMEAKKLLVFSVPLDLNQAAAEDLCLVPGIGDSLAVEITAYRARRGAFRSVEELKHVRSIGEKKYQSVKPFLTVK